VTGLAVADAFTPVVGDGRRIPAGDSALSDDDIRALATILAQGRGEGGYLYTRVLDAEGPEHVALAYAGETIACIRDRGLVPVYSLSPAGRRAHNEVARLAQTFGVSVSIIAALLRHGLQPDGHNISRHVFAGRGCPPACAAPHHLVFGTRAENREDAVRDGALPGVFTADDVLAMRARYREDENATFPALGEEFGGSYEAARNAITGASWRHLNDIEPPVPARGRARGAKGAPHGALTIEKVVLMRRRYGEDEGSSFAALGGEFGVSAAATRNAITGDTWVVANGTESPVPARRSWEHRRRGATNGRRRWGLAEPGLVIEELTSEGVVLMRRRKRENPRLSYVMLGREFRVTARTARDAITGARWNRVNGTEPPVPAR
jgi:hypothetical protein